MPNSRHFFNQSFKFIWMSLAVLLILFAVIVSASRMLIPLVAEYKHDLEDIASQQLGRPVKVGSINAEWIGLWPSIHLSDVKIQSRSTKNTWLEVDEAWLTLDLLSFISKGYPDTERVKIDGLKLDVQRVDEVAYIVNGELFHLGENSPDDQAALMKWFFSKSHLQLVDSDFSYHDNRFSSRQFDLKQVNVQLENNNNLHHAYGHFKVPGQQDSSLSFVLDMTGDMRQPQKVFNKLYLQGDVIVTENIQEWLKPYVNIQKGAVDLRMWMSGQIQKINRVKAELTAKDLSWSITGKDNVERSSQVDDLKASLFLTRRHDGWSFDVENFSLRKNDIEWPQSEIHLSYLVGDQNKPALLEGTIGYVKLQDISGLISENLPAKFEIGQDIRKLALQGVMSNVEFRLGHSEKNIDHYYLNADFKDLGFSRWREMPGVSGLDGKILLSDKKGTLSLVSEETTLDFGDIFRQAIDVSKLQGDIHWNKYSDKYSLSFDDLQADSAYVETLSRAEIEIPFDNSSPFIDMNVDFKNGKASAAKFYLPRKVLGPNTVKWLDKAFVNGSVPNGKMILHGLAENFPFKNGEGTFLVDFDVKELQLEYGAEWPHLHQLDANVVFSEDSLNVAIHGGELMQLKLMPSIMKIPHMGNNSIVNMGLNLSGKTQHLLEYINKIPAANKARKITDTFEVKGEMISQLDMSIPLNNPAQFDMQGVSQFMNNELKLNKWAHAFKRIKGKLHYSFDDNQFKFDSKKLKAEYLGKPAEASVTTRIGPQKKPVVGIELQARMGLSSLLDSYISPDQVVFSGESDWLVKMNISEKDLNLDIESELKGETLVLPDNFAKSADETRRLKILSTLNEEKVSTFQLEYGEDFNAIFGLTDLYTKPSVTKGEILLGQGSVKLPEQQGFVIRGKLNRLTVDHWMDLFPVDNDEKPLVNPTLINKAELVIDKVISGQQEFNQLSLIAIRRTSDLIVTLGANEVAGEVIIPLEMTDADPLVMNLKYLYIKTASDKLESSVLDPRKLPAIKLESQKLYLNDTNLGKLFLKVHKDPDGLIVDDLKIKSDLLMITADGSWLFKNSWHESAFNMDFSTPKIGAAMKLFDFQASIENGKANAHLQASWSGPPHWFEMKRLNGKMNLSIKDGQLNDIEPGGGRIFGLLSVQNLPRRLSLDFSDLFKKGFGFDKIEGLFNIADGDAYTNNLYLDGPAARIDISGRIGLASEEYDQEVLVTPKISSSIPILGLAAGPQVALGLFLTEKILRKNINKISRTLYSVTGSWAEPVINKISKK